MLCAGFINNDVYPQQVRQILSAPGNSLNIIGLYFPLEELLIIYVTSILCQKPYVLIWVANTHFQLKVLRLQFVPGTPPPPPPITHISKLDSTIVRFPNNNQRNEITTVVMLVLFSKIHYCILNLFPALIQ